MSVYNVKKKSEKTVVHMQFLTWPSKWVSQISYIDIRICRICIYILYKYCNSYNILLLSGFPSSPGALLTFSTDVMTEQALRRCSKPIVVHCLDGRSLNSLFLVAAATVYHIRAGCGIVDVPLLFKGLLKCRKQIVNKESLLFAYQLVLYHAQDILMKRKICTISTICKTFSSPTKSYLYFWNIRWHFIIYPFNIRKLWRIEREQG